MSADHLDHDFRVSPFKAGLLCRCPACGEGPLYRGILTVADRCTACGLDYATADSGDGPAVFVILILGAAVAAAAGVTEVVFKPPYWVHLAIWLPTILIGSIALLRPFKATLIALQFRNGARQDPE